MALNGIAKWKCWYAWTAWWGCASLSGI